MQQDKFLEFLDKYCKNKLENLMEFDFSALVYNQEFGCPNRSFDCDDTNLTRIIFSLLYSGKLSNLTFENIGTGQIYRGDTINTFRTIFGERISEKHFLGIEKYSSDKLLLDKVEKFYHKYHTIGNFVLLPNKKFNNTTLNLYRGTNSWRDFFDIFLFELRKCLNNESNKDETLYGLVKENENYFKDINYDFHKFLSMNYLDEYSTKTLFSPYLYHWKYRNNYEQHSKTYVEFANNFIDVSSELITNRAKIIIEQLKKSI